MNASCWFTPTRLNSPAPLVLCWWHVQEMFKVLKQKKCLKISCVWRFSFYCFEKCPVPNLRLSFTGTSTPSTWAPRAAGTATGPVATSTGGWCLRALTSPCYVCWRPSWSRHRSSCCSSASWSMETQSSPCKVRIMEKHAAPADEGTVVEQLPLPYCRRDLDVKLEFTHSVLIVVMYVS